jgi:outer membrane protein OmpA-like peptidoglycan-associated protein
MRNFLAILIVAAIGVATPDREIVAQSNKRPLSSTDVRATLFAEADTALKIAREKEAALLAPGAFEAGLLSYQQAENKFQQGGKLEEIRAHLQQATQHFQQALVATNWAGQAFSGVLTARDDARHAQAPTYATSLWQQAEAKMKKAAHTLERGNLKSAIKQAESIEKLYRQTELEAIQRHPLTDWRGLSSTIDAQRSSIAQLKQEITGNQARVASLQQQVATLEKEVKGRQTTESAKNGTQAVPASRIEIDTALQAYFSPNDALVFRKDRNLIVRLFTLDFVAETPRLSALSAETLLRVGEIVRKFPKAGVTVGGHVYSAKNQQENLMMSRERAESVKRYLIENLHVSQALVAVGYGDTAPIPKNELVGGPIKNERLDILVELVPDQVSSLFKQ